MSPQDKQSLLETAKNHISHMQTSIGRKKDQVKGYIGMITKKMSTPHIYSNEIADKSEKEVDKMKLKEAYLQIDQLNYLKGSPYFAKCIVKFGGSDELKTLHFAKFPFPEESIYSWIAPAAALRFKDPGNVNFQLQDKTNRDGTLLEKSNYTIKNSQVLYMSIEGIGRPKTLVYQSEFSNRKSKFFLTDIIERMEEYQDSVIRIPYSGSMLISGPAGSGKTTLALHRVAYLSQSPETSDFFPSKKIIIFVQDLSTKEYFNYLLPELGIKEVNITTYIEWIRNKMKLNDFSDSLSLIFTNKEDQLEYEYAKSSIDFSKISDTYSNLDFPYRLLKKIYQKHLSEFSFALFEIQRKRSIIDRYDLNLLFHCYLNYFDKKRTIDYKNPRPLFNLIVIDEAENYLKLELVNIKRCLNPQTKSIVFVGDLVQQTRMFTIQSWNDINENFNSERIIKLPKVYRNTKKILEYLQSLNFEVDINNGIKDGNEVVSKSFANESDQIQYIVDQVKGFKDERIIGILGKEEYDLYQLQNILSKYKNIRFMTAFESQGVEFDIVFIARLDKFLDKPNHVNSEINKQLEKINHDLLYVAMTRAMNELYVCDVQRRD